MAKKVGNPAPKAGGKIRYEKPEWQNAKAKFEATGEYGFVVIAIANAMFWSMKPPAWALKACEGLRVRCEQSSDVVLGPKKKGPKGHPSDDHLLNKMARLSLRVVGKQVSGPNGTKTAMRVSPRTVYSLAVEALGKNASESTIKRIVRRYRRELGQETDEVAASLRADSLLVEMYPALKKSRLF